MQPTKATLEPSATAAPAPSPAVLPRFGQAGKGVARRIGRHLAEPAFVAGCGLAGALHAAQHGSLYGDAPVIGTAAATAALATLAGMVKLLMEARRARARTLGTLGGVALRLAVVLLCVGLEAYGLSCTCDDVSGQTYVGTVTFD